MPDPGRPGDAQSAPEGPPLAARRSGSDRVAWIDLAKAGAIILVVVFHVAGAAAAFLLPNAQDFWMTGWKALSDFLVPVRMPLFFLMSGLLAGAAVNRPWRKLFRSRYANLLWPYLIWSVSFSFVYGFAVAPQQWFTATRASLINVAFGGDAYWFLPTLVVLFTVARAFRKFAPALVFAAFVIWITVPLSQPLLAEVLPTGLATNLGRWGTFGIWFLLGCFGRPFVSRIAALPLLPLLPLAAGCYAVMVWFYYVADNRGLPWIIGLNVSGLLTAVQLAVLVSRSSRLAAVGSHIARRTLPIYLLHPLIVYSVVALSRVPGVSLRLPQDSPVVNFFFVPALTAALVWVSMLIYDAAMKGPLRVVFTPASSGGGSLESRHSDHDQSTRT